MNTVLVVAAHPDDDVLGCGGAIARFVERGVSVHVLFMADGVTSRYGDPSVGEQDLIARRSMALEASSILGVSSTEFCDFPDNRLDTIAQLDLTKRIEQSIATYRPDTVLSHHSGDLNIDHRCVNAAVIPACRPVEGSSVATVMFFEVLSSTEWHVGNRFDNFHPDCFVDIGDVLDRKLAALSAYDPEMRKWPHPRSRRGVETLAAFRGMSVGVSAAEGFSTGRRLWDL